MVLRGLESNERGIEAIGLPRSAAVAPAARVTRKPVEKFVMPEILRALITIGLPGCADSGRVKECEAQRVVAGPVGAGLRAGKDGDAEFAASIREVEPAMRRHLEHFVIVRGAFDSSRAPVVRCVLVR